MSQELSSSTAPLSASEPDERTASAKAAKDLKPIFVEIDKRLAGIEASLSGGTGLAHAGPRNSLAARRTSLIVWAATAGVATVSMALILSLALAIVELRRAKVIDLDAKANKLDQTLNLAQAEIKRLEAEVDGLKQTKHQLAEVIGRMEGVRSKFDDTTKKVDTAITRVGEFGEKIGQIEGKVKNDATSLEKRLNDLGSDLASKIGDHVEKAYSRPVQDMRATVDDLSNQFVVFTERSRQPARPERTAVVVFDSAAQRAESSRDSLRRLFCRTPLRSGFEGYQLALYEATGGRVDLQPRLPFGDEPASSLPFSGEWTTMEGRIEQSQDFDPKPIFIGVPPETARRVVLIVSGQAEPPSVDSKLWPDNVRANVVVVGSRDPKKLDAWKKFCEKRGGQARSVENSSGSLLRELKELAKPTPPHVAR